MPSFGSEQEARDYLDRSNRGAVTWDDNFRSAAEDYLSARDPVKIAKKQYQEAIAPSVASLEASIPEVQQKFATEKERLETRREPLKQRYDNLLAEVSGRAQQSVNQATKITNEALARRGILGGSFRDNEIFGATEPIRSQERAQIKDIGLSREEGELKIEDLLAQLTGQETESTRSIRNAIAQLQAGAGTQALTAAQAEIARQDQLAQQKVLNEIARQEMSLKELAAAGAGSGNQIVNVGGKGYVINPATGQVVSSFGGGGGGASGW